MTGPGRFIVIDGPSGVGKTTTTALLCDHLAKDGWEVAATKEPTQSTLGTTARNGTDEFRGLTLACLVAADRYHHLEREIRPALADGMVVVCDRYLATSLVLQRLDGVDPDFLWDINRHIDRPDLTIILTGDPTRSRARAADRGTHSRFHRGGAEAGRAENDLYLQVATELTEAAFTVQVYDVSDHQPEQVAAALFDQVRTHLL
jgi:dTMP kinase